MCYIFKHVHYVGTENVNKVMNVLKNKTYATENVNNVMNVLKNITHGTENVNNVMNVLKNITMCYIF
jgi:RNA binding exosome subunit